MHHYYPSPTLTNNPHSQSNSYSINPQITLSNASPYRSHFGFIGNQYVHSYPKMLYEPAGSSPSKIYQLNLLPRLARNVEDSYLWNIAERRMSYPTGRHLLESPLFG